MQVSVDSSRFDEHQLFFVRKLCEMLIADLRRAGFDDEAGEELAEQVAFTMCSLTDGSTNLEMNGKKFRPCLMFSQDENYSVVLSSGSGSWMHEYVGSTVWDVYHEDD